MVRAKSIAVFASHLTQGQAKVIALVSKVLCTLPPLPFPSSLPMCLSPPPHCALRPLRPWAHTPLQPCSLFPFLLSGKLVLDLSLHLQIFAQTHSLREAFLNHFFKIAPLPTQTHPSTHSPSCFTALFSPRTPNFCYAV